MLRVKSERSVLRDCRSFDARGGEGRRLTGRDELNRTTIGFSRVENQTRKGAGRWRND
jgi:hypothetical protein